MTKSRPVLRPRRALLCATRAPASAGMQGRTPRARHGLATHRAMSLNHRQAMPASSPFLQSRCVVRCAPTVRDPTARWCSTARREPRCCHQSITREPDTTPLRRVRRCCADRLPKKCSAVRLRHPTTRRALVHRRWRRTRRRWRRVGRTRHDVR